MPFATTTRRNREAGVALAHVLILGSALLGLAVGALVLTRSDQMISQNVVSSTKAFWIAAGGAEVGRDWLLQPGNASAGCLDGGGCTIGPQGFADGQYTVTLARYAAADPRLRITAVGTVPANARKTIEEIVLAPFFDGNDGLIQIDGARLPTDMEDPRGDNSGYRIPDWTIDGRNHDPSTGLLDPSCPPVPPVGGVFDPANTALQNELDELRCGIVQQANECCLADGTTNPGMRIIPGFCEPGVCGDPATCNPGTCAVGACYPGGCLDATCVPASCPVSACSRGTCAPGDPGCAAGTCVVEVATCTAGTCLDGESCAAGTCPVGACTEGTCAPGDPSCVAGNCKNGRCSPGACSGKNCVSATCVVDLGACAPGACTGDNCTAGTCAIQPCQPGSCAGAACVAAACAVGSCAQGTCADTSCAAGSCTATCTEGVCADASCVSGTCGLPGQTAICPDGCEPGMYFVRGGGAEPQWLTPTWTDPDPTDPTDQPSWAQVCDASISNCCVNLSLSPEGLRATSIASPGAGAPAAPGDRGPLLPDTADPTDGFPLEILDASDMAELEKKITAILRSALLADASQRMCISEQSIRGETRIYGTLADPKIVVVRDPADQNPLVEALSKASPCPNDSTRVNNLTIENGAVVQGAGLLVLPRELVVKDAIFDWRGLVLILENGRIEAWDDACGGIFGGLLLQKNDTGNNARLDFDKNVENAATCAAYPNNAFSVNYSCETLANTNEMLVRVLSWREVFGD